jgi:hypothetical protein
MATTLRDPRDGRRRTVRRVVLIRGAERDADRVDGAEVIGRNSQDNLGDDTGRGVRAADPVAVDKIRIAGNQRNRGPCRVHGQRSHG